MLHMASIGGSRKKHTATGAGSFDFGPSIRYNSDQKGRTTDDIRIGSISPYHAYHDEQPPAGDKRKRGGHPQSEPPDDEVILDQPTTSDAEADDSLGVKDYYAPSDDGEEPAP
jgi:hypothetical protein